MADKELRIHPNPHLSLDDQIKSAENLVDYYSRLAFDNLFQMREQQNLLVALGRKRRLLVEEQNNGLFPMSSDCPARREKGQGK